MHPNLSTTAVCEATTSRNAEDPRPPNSGLFRVLKVTQSYYPFLERGGPAVKVRALAHGLAKKGHAVSVLTSDLGIKDAASASAPMMRTPEGWRYREEQVETLYLPSCLSYRALTFNLGAFRFCRDELARFDIVHIYGTYDLLGPIVARACRRRAIPYLVEPMGMFRPLIRNFALKKAYRRLLGGSVVRGAARLLATSAQEQRELVEEGIPSQKIVVRRNGIELPQLADARNGFRRQWKIPPEALLVLFLGRIVSKKSPELLLDAFARWQSESRSAASAVLVFAGPFEDAEYRSELEAHVTRLRLASSVLFTGPLYDDHKWAALVDADVFVLPSQNENFGNAAAEAVACGTPVVVTDRCGIAPLIEGRAGLVIPHACDALAEALRKLSEAGLRERLKRGCVDVARGLSWEQPLAQMETLYSELAGSRIPRRQE